MSKLSENLKNNENVVAPEWAVFVKTGVSKERPPVQEDWWFIRTASILKKVHKYGPIGVNKLSKQYGGRKNRGHKPDRKMNGSTNIIRKCMQQLEKAGLIQQVESPKAGKTITKEGLALIRECEEN